MAKVDVVARCVGHDGWALMLGWVKRIKCMHDDVSSSENTGQVAHAQGPQVLETTWAPTWAHTALLVARHCICSLHNSYHLGFCFLSFLSLFLIAKGTTHTSRFTLGIATAIHSSQACLGICPTTEPLHCEILTVHL